MLELEIYLVCEKQKGLKKKWKVNAGIISFRPGSILWQLKAVMTVKGSFRIVLGSLDISQFSLHVLQKRIGSIVLWPSHSWKNFPGQIWIMVEVIFFDPSEIGVLGLTWRVRLQIEDLGVKNCLFLIDMCIRCYKI